MTNLLFVNGIPDDGVVEVLQADLDGQVNYKCSGTCDFFSYLTSPVWRKQLIVLDDRDIEITLGAGTHMIVNQIAEPDSHGKTLQRVQNMMDRYPEIPVFNPPALIQKTRRDKLAELLQGIEGLVVPKVVRIEPRCNADIFETIRQQGMAYPVIVKGAGLHGGKQTARLDAVDDVAPLYALPLDGRPYYLIPFIESAQQGVYHKMRLFMVQGKVYPRHLRFLDHWLVHFQSARQYMDQHPDYYAREQAFLEHFNQDVLPDLIQPLKQVYERLPLDFWGIDLCRLPDGQWLVFEANANMLAFYDKQPELKYFKPVVQNLAQAMFDAIHQILK